MNRIAKMAVVLLYLVQLVVVFREQLEHMYESAVHAVQLRLSSVEPHGSRKDGKGGTPAKASHAIVSPIEKRQELPTDHRVTLQAFRGFEQIAASTLLAMQYATVSAPHHNGHQPHPPHEHDKHKMMHRRHGTRDPRTFVIINFWNLIRSFRPAAVRAELAEPVSRHLSFV